MQCAKATHIFSAKNIRILCIESAKTVNEMTVNELIKLTTLWITGPRTYGQQVLRFPHIAISSLIPSAWTIYSIFRKMSQNLPPNPGHWKLKNCPTSLRLKDEKIVLLNNIPSRSFQCDFLDFYVVPRKNIYSILIIPFNLLSEESISMSTTLFSISNTNANTSRSIQNWIEGFVLAVQLSVLHYFFINLLWLINANYWYKKNIYLQKIKVRKTNLVLPKSFTWIVSLLFNLKTVYLPSVQLISRPRGQTRSTYGRKKILSFSYWTFFKYRFQNL